MKKMLIISLLTALTIGLAPPQNLRALPADYQAAEDALEEKKVEWYHAAIQRKIVEIGEVNVRKAILEQQLQDLINTTAEQWWIDNCLTPAALDGYTDNCPMF